LSLRPARKNRANVASLTAQIIFDLLHILIKFACVSKTKGKGSRVQSIYGSINPVGRNSPCEVVVRIGSSTFEAYNRTLRRVMWADFIDAHLKAAREQQYRASLVEEPYKDQKPIVALAMKQANEV